MVWSLLRGQDLDLGFKREGLGLRVEGLGFRDQRLGFKVP